ncbi:cyclase family protein, partial [Streptomyces sp. SID10244]|nr:cyclase family protein [Streptomyces sp. SID10244]
MDPIFPAHHHLLGADKYGLTQLQNLGAVPRSGAMLVVSPLPIVGGTGSPARVLALVPA